MAKKENVLNNFLFGAIEESTSPANSLDLTDLKKTGRLLVVAVVAAAATAFLDFLVQWLAGANLPYKEVIVVLATPLVELGRRYIAEHTK